MFQAKDEVSCIEWNYFTKINNSVQIVFFDTACCMMGINRMFFCFKVEMSSWIQSITSSIPTGSSDSPGGPRALSRAMTMPPISPGSGDAGGVTMRNKDGKEKDREKRFSFFGKKK